MVARAGSQTNSFALMILAAYRDTGYKFVLLLHIVTVVVATAPAVVHPILVELEKRRSDSDLATLAGRLSSAWRIYAISLVVTGVIGLGLISMSGDVIGWGDAWISLSILLWVAVNGVLHGLMIPAEKALAAGDGTAIKKFDMAGRIIVVLMIVLLYLMVIKPGGGGI